MRALPRLVWTAGLLLGVLSVSAAPEWLGAPEPPLLAGVTGAAEIFDSHQSLFWGVEYRPAFRCCRLSPWLFFGSGKHNEFYAAVGVLLNIRLGDRWVLTPSLGGGYYRAAGGLDLGFDTEFRSGIELAWRHPRGFRIGLAFAHLSNGSLSDFNPGTETLGLTCAVPLDFWHRRPATDSPAP